MATVNHRRVWQRVKLCALCSSLLCNAVAGAGDLETGSTIRVPSWTERGWVMGCNPSRHVGLDYEQCSLSGVGWVGGESPSRCWPFVFRKSRYKYVRDSCGFGMYSSACQFEGGKGRRFVCRVRTRASYICLLWQSSSITQRLVSCCTENNAFW